MHLQIVTSYTESKGPLPLVLLGSNMYEIKCFNYRKWLSCMSATSWEVLDRLGLNPTGVEFSGNASGVSDYA